MSGPGSKLVVNADDFGASPGVNEAVILGGRAGVRTSCSLMVTGAAVDDAVRLAKETPELSVGLHIVLALGKSVLPHREIPHLVDREGNFASDPAIAGLRYFFCPFARRELSREIEAQFEKFRSTGLALSHVDSHCHLHVHPVVFDRLVRAAERYGVRRMRVPTDDAALEVRLSGSGSFRTAAFAAIFEKLSARMKRRLDLRGFTYPRRVYGFFRSGRMSEQYFLAVLENLEEAKSEIYFHPGVLPRGSAVPTAPQVQRARELSALLSPAVRDRARRLGIRFVGYPDLD